MEKRNIELSGHIIDSLILTKTMGIIMDKGGEFDILEIDVGRKKSDISIKEGGASMDSVPLDSSAEVREQKTRQTYVEARRSPLFI